MKKEEFKYKLIEQSSMEYLIRIVQTVVCNAWDFKLLANR